MFIGSNKRLKLELNFKMYVLGTIIFIFINNYYKLQLYDLKCRQQTVINLKFYNEV